MTDSSSTNDTTSVLFVCLGNICRSPLAEGVMRHLVEERGLDERYQIDSAGTGAWHVGESPDERATEVARRNGVKLSGRARRVERGDLDRFDWVVAMDRDNLRRVEALEDEGDGDARVCLLRDFDPDPGDGEVPDPYYGGPDGFEKVFTLVRRSVEALLDHLEEGGGDAPGRAR